MQTRTPEYRLLHSGVCSFRQRWIHIRTHFAVLKTKVTLATDRNPSREDRHKVMPDGAPSSKLKHHQVGKYAVIGAPILSRICYVYILMQGYAK